MTRLTATIASLVLTAGIALAASTEAQNATLQLGKAAAAPGSTLKIPIVLAAEDGGNLPIEAIALNVRWNLGDAIADAVIEPTGATAKLQSIFEASPQTATSTAWIASFQEALTHRFGDSIQTVAVISITLAESAVPGSVISLSLDPRTSVLGNRQGTSGFSVDSKTLRLIDGQIRVLEPGDKPRGGQR